MWHRHHLLKLNSLQILVAVLVAKLCSCDPMDCIAQQAPLSMGFPRQKYWSGLLFPSPGDLSTPEIHPMSCALGTDSFLLSHLRSTLLDIYLMKIPFHMHLETQHFVITKKLKTIKMSSNAGKDKYTKILFVSESGWTPCMHVKESQQLETEKANIYHLYQGRLFMLLYAILFRNIYICGKLINYREKNKGMGNIKFMKFPGGKTSRRIILEGYTGTLRFWAVLFLKLSGSYLVFRLVTNY